MQKGDMRRVIPALVLLVLGGALTMIVNGGYNPTTLSKWGTEARKNELAPDMKVLGLKLNAQVELPVCQGEPNDLYPSCLTRDELYKEVAYIAKDERPGYLLQLHVDIDSSTVLQGLRLSFDGNDYDKVRESLVEKYGKPDYSNSEKYAAWTFRNLSVLLSPDDAAFKATRLGTDGTNARKL